jgi:hypothetical protein
MKNSMARFRETSSFVAGLLIGLSIVAAGFAMMAANSSDWKALWVFGAPVILALGLTLQVVVTTKPRGQGTTDPEHVAFPIEFMELTHEQPTFPSGSRDPRKSPLSNRRLTDEAWELEGRCATVLLEPR